MRLQCKTISGTSTETGAQRVVRQFVEMGVSHAFCVPGADVVPLVQALEQESKIRTIFATHEFSAGAMEDGYSRVSGKPGLAVAIGGPGASYLVAAASSAARDGSSVVFLTGAPPDDSGATSVTEGWPDGQRKRLLTLFLCPREKGS